MIDLDNDTLGFRFPDVHPDAACRVSFIRTLRIPDDNREYPLPPGFAPFPLRHVEDYASRLPASWAEHGGVLLPMYQAEALWISFSSDYPMALKIAAGKINAVIGEIWSTGLSADPQDYLVVPDQPWLDGFCVQKGLIRQFVAMPLGAGYTAEEQLTGSAEHGGLQIIAYPMKAERYEEMQKEWVEIRANERRCLSSPVVEMGLAPGGLMRQEVYEDPYGADAWDQTASSRCFVHIMNSVQWLAATGTKPPGKPPSAADYTRAGLPWFNYYAADLPALKGARKLAQLDSVAAKTIKTGAPPLVDNDPVTPATVVALGTKGRRVRAGAW